MLRGTKTILTPVCWQPIHIFHYLISCLHQCFANIDFPSQISNERRPYSLRLFDRLSSLSLHSRKHEIFSSQGHILIIIWTADTVIMLIAPIFYWSSHDHQNPLISFHTSMDCITWPYWRHFAFDSYFATYLNIDSLNGMGVMFYLLWSLLLILIIALGISIVCNIDLTP